MMKFPTEWKNKFMFQTTNQINEIPSKTHSEVNRGLSSQPIQVHTLILSPYMVGFKPAKGLKKNR